ncbi:short chain dehydrogenase/reductase family oxidoreductase [Penicillium cosmopolitanum]|uniref:Short chain dehydrogenase/reductase family oxidoreductase n=1 Tax=Penicillium cosmopolitanum TaxID=1131564 RepID=A0A9X0BDF3_9EURO|nr:short chain dehydrogenase/reductase family oxidoreductase [Penicillium cosmopolitanum]KAJ5408658.1 short chain dehydrogenase/reductase family oxidoreductase [Penicillium cosmopolitanum]
MTSLNISVDDIPSLEGKTAIVTGGCSGIGWESAQLLASKGATVYVLDLHPPPSEKHEGGEQQEKTLSEIYYRACNVTSWSALRAVFDEIPQVDIAIANAGVSEECDYFADSWDAEGKIEEPEYAVVEVNYRSVLNFIKLSLSAFRRAGNRNGSLVLTTSATAYSPEHSLPVYSATKLALVGLVRALRSSLLHQYGATINAVAPAATITSLLPANLAAPILAAGAPVSMAQHVAVAVVYSATASQEHSVESYGNDGPEQLGPGRWNGRVILTLGDKWTELEEPLAERRAGWFGAWNTEMTALQQKLTDMRFKGM